MPMRPGAEAYLDLNGGISTTVQDLARVDCLYLAQR